MKKLIDYIKKREREIKEQIKIQKGIFLRDSRKMWEVRLDELERVKRCLKD